MGEPQIPIRGKGKERKVRKGSVNGIGIFLLRLACEGGTGYVTLICNYEYHVWYNAKAERFCQS
jgi:hypothetical protein